MTATAARALTLATAMVDMLVYDADSDIFEIDGHVYTAADLRAEFERGLASLRQGPRIADDLGVQSMIRSEIAIHGSEAEVARRMGITRQSLHAVYDGHKSPGPAVLSYLHLRKIGGRTRYEMVDRP